eukprot:PLAT3048.1.p1 GENE.PLAT3048.1~~PLAT3048.1.p1  ORF type:complete len:388 (+),score=103.16 PLAT3048.1:43-1206(+)
MAKCVLHSGALLLVVLALPALCSAARVNSQLRARATARTRAGLVSMSGADVPGWKCQVCEDVAQTWRETVPCGGGRAEDIDPTQSGCMLPANCEVLKEPRQYACLSMKKTWQNDKDVQKKLWQWIVEMKMHAFDACSALGKCPPRDAPESKVCNTTLASCETIMCDDDHDCPDDCFVCYHIIRTWPAFMEICKPEGVTPPQPTAFLELNDARRQRRRVGRLAGQRQRQQAARAPAYSRAAALAMQDGGMPPAALLQLRTRGADGKTRERGLGSPPLTEDDSASTDASTLMRECFKLWNEFEHSAKERFFASYLSMLGQWQWDANLACKCLGKCPYDQYEAMSLISPCNYDSYLDPSGALFPDLREEDMKLAKATRTANNNKWGAQLD